MTFDGNTGTGSMGNQSANYNVATALTANAFTMTGYTFSGWNTLANGTGTAYADGASYPFTASATLYAQWTANNYTVTYDGNSNTGGTVPTDGNNYNIGNTVTVLANTGSLTRTGYTFNGWNTAANGSGASYAASGSATFTMGSANVTLYAQWTINSYTVTFDGNGNTGGLMSNQSANYNVATALTANAFTKTGYTFSGWNTASNGSGTAYADGASYPFTTSITLYAQWVQVTYTGPTPTGTGTASATVSGGGAGCGFTAAQFVSPSVSAPPGVTFPHGLFDFTLGVCSGTATLAVTYPSAVPAGAQYWKYGPTPTDGTQHWYTIPAVISGNTITFDITDGGTGDDDLLPNGIIVDQGGPGVPAAQAAPAAIPTLSEWGLILLAGLLGLFGMGVTRWRSKVEM